jgi:hypothetical protein
MSNTNPFAAVIDAQHRAIEQSRDLAEQSVEAQKRGFETATGALDALERTSGSVLDAQQSFVDAWFDAVESTAPGAAADVEELRAAVAESVEAGHEISDETWQVVEEVVDAQSDAYDSLAEEYLAALETVADASEDSLSEFESAAEAVDVDLEE